MRVILYFTVQFVVQNSAARIVLYIALCSALHTVLIVQCVVQCTLQHEVQCTVQSSGPINISPYLETTERIHLFTTLLCNCTEKIGPNLNTQFIKLYVPNWP